MPHHQHEARGVWSVGEHERFLEAMTLYPRGPWRLITKHVGSRSIKQVQTHAQKYQQKLLRHQRGLRKRKTRVKRPEHRVDEQTFDQFTNGCIVRHQQHQRSGSVSSDDDRSSSTASDSPRSETSSEASLDLPTSPLALSLPDSPTSVVLSVTGKTLEEWEYATIQSQTQALTQVVTQGMNQQLTVPSLMEDDAPLESCMLLPEWSDWHMDDFFKPFESLPVKEDANDASLLPSLSWTELPNLTV